MKALTIRQPWASLIAAGMKTIETRGWSTRYWGPLLIHAGKTKPVSLPGYVLARPEHGLPWRLQRWSCDGRQGLWTPPPDLSISEEEVAGG